MTRADERKAAEEVEAVVSSLARTTPRTDALVMRLRNAANAATRAIKNLSSESALDAARGEAATALNGAAGLLHKQTLTQEMIDRAKSAVATWLRELAVLD